MICRECPDYFEFEKHGLIKRRCGGIKPVAILPAGGSVPSWCPRRDEAEEIELDKQGEI